MNEVELSYVNKYKTKIKHLALVFMILIIIMGVGLIALGTYMIVISEANVALIFVGGILIVMGLSDIPLGIYFRIRVTKNVTNMSEEEALKRYKRIYGKI